MISSIKGSAYNNKDASKKYLMHIEVIGRIFFLHIKITNKLVTKNPYKKRKSLKELHGNILKTF